MSILDNFFEFSWDFMIFPCNYGHMPSSTTSKLTAWSQMVNRTIIMMKKSKIIYHIPVTREVLDTVYSFFLSFFCSGHRGYKAYSLWGGVVPSPGIGYDYL